MEGPMSKKTNKTNYEGKPQREHQVLKLSPIRKSISNNEREGLLERMPSLNEPSPIATTCFKSISNNERGGLPEKDA
jgi:hypothetical protein